MFQTFYKTLKALKKSTHLFSSGFVTTYLDAVAPIYGNLTWKQYLKPQDSGYSGYSGIRYTPFLNGRPNRNGVV